MSIEWSKNLSTGIEWQDKQHKELFNRMNSLMDAMNVGLGKEEVLKLFRFLDEYFIVHFDAEEHVMHKYNYPDVLDHITRHTYFIDEVGRLKEEADSKGVSTGLVIQLQRKVVDWFINHIGTVDKKLGAFLVDAGEGRNVKKSVDSGTDRSAAPDKAAVEQ